MLDGAQRMIATLKSDPSRKSAVDAMRSHEVMAIEQYLISERDGATFSGVGRWRRI